MLRDINSINRVLGKVPIPVPAPDTPLKACFFAFLTVMGNGVLGVMKLFLNQLIVQLNVLLVVLEYQLIQAELLRQNVLSQERLFTNTIRQAPADLINSIYREVEAEIQKQTPQGQAFLQGLTLQDLRQCAPVDELFKGISQNLNLLDERLDELDFLVERESRFTDCLRIGIEWAKQKRRLYQWYVDSISININTSTP